MRRGVRLLLFAAATLSTMSRSSVAGGSSDDVAVVPIASDADSAGSLGRRSGNLLRLERRRRRRLEDENADGDDGDADNADGADDGNNDDDVDNADSADDDAEEDGGDDEDEEAEAEEEEEGERDDDDASDDRYQYDDVAGYHHSDASSTQTGGNVNAKNKIHQWESDAQYTAWTLYETSPSDWTSGQWTFFVVSSILMCAGVCVGAVCRVHCKRFFDKLDKDDDSVGEGGVSFENFEDDGDQLAPLSPRKKKKEKDQPWTPGPGGRIVVGGGAGGEGEDSTCGSTATKQTSGGSKRSNHRGDFTSNHYEQYREDNESSHIEEDDATMDTDGDGTDASRYYEPPASPGACSSAATSLADYTSVQREKEARIFEAWRASHNGEDGERGEGEDYDDWKEGYNAKFAKPLENKAKTELDAAFLKKIKEKRERGRRTGKDKLLEAREFRHNQTGWYL